jgi:hypothetical protein
VKTARLIATELGLTYYNAADNSTTFAGTGKSGTPYSQVCRRTCASAFVMYVCDTKVTFGMSFQSRFGYDPWVKPYSEATLDVRHLHRTLR